MKKLTRIKTFALIAFMSLGFTSCNNDDDTEISSPAAESSITELAVATPSLSILVQALTRAELAAKLNEDGAYTVFAPTDDAFTAFFATISPTTNVDNVDLPTLKNVLLNHVISGKIKSNAIPASTYVSTLSPINSSENAPTLSMFVQKSGMIVTLNGGVSNKGAVVSTADIDASNGVIHIVDNVISLPTIVNHVVANPDFETLQVIVTSTSGAYGDQSQVLATLSGLTAEAPATLFAPDNDAFTTATTGGGFAVGASASQLSQVLQYHVTTVGNVRSASLSNNQVVSMLLDFNSTTVILGENTVDIKDFADGLSRVFQADIQCSNGVIHGIDGVLQPSFNVD